MLDIPKPVGNQGKKDEKMDPTTNPTKESGKDNKPESTATKHNRPESTVTKDNKTESTATKDNKTESTATKDNKTESTVTKDNKTESTATKDNKTESTVTKDNKMESTATKDNKTESIATKGNKTESSAQLHDEDSPSDKKRKLSATDGKGTGVYNFYYHLKLSHFPFEIDFWKTKNITFLPFHSFNIFVFNGFIKKVFQ